MCFVKKAKNETVDPYLILMFEEWTSCPGINNVNENLIYFSLFSFFVFIYRSCMCMHLGEYIYPYLPNLYVSVAVTFAHMHAYFRFYASVVCSECGI